MSRDPEQPDIPFPPIDDGIQILAVRSDAKPPVLIGEVYRNGRQPRRGAVILSWIVILTVVTLVFGLVFIGQFVNPVDSPPSRADLLQANMMAKYAVGCVELVGVSSSEAVSLAGAIDHGPLQQRYCYAILIGEFSGPQAALDQLQQIDRLASRLDYQPTEDQQHLRWLLGLLYTDYDARQFDAPSLAWEDDQYIADHLGWCGRLSLNPAGKSDPQVREKLLGEAMRTVVTLMAFLGLGLIMLLAGIALLFSFAFLLAAGRLRSALVPQSFNGAIYVETFAIWIVVFLGLSFAAEWMTEQWQAPGYLAIAFPLLSLGVLIWPVVRGVPLSEVRGDLGWKLKNPLVEMVLGVICYIAQLPILAMAFIVVVFMVALAGGLVPQDELSSGGGPSHPIQQDFAAADEWLPLLQLALLACVIAPLVEEIVFRGLLYRHLRDLGWRVPIWLSVALAAGVSSLLFAAIHPQGIFGIPILMTISLGFSLAREWRGSLIAPMTMHALNNGMVTALMFIMI